MPEGQVSLDSLLCMENPPLHSVFYHPEFIVALKKGNQALINYIIRNFDIILEIIFEEKHKSVLETKPYLMAIDCNDNNMKKTLIEKTRFVSYILDYPRMIKIYNPPSQALYFSALPTLILDENSEIFSCFAKKEFFDSILQHCDSIEAFNFMRTIINHTSHSFKIFFDKVNLPEMCTKYLNGQDVLNFHIQKLFTELIPKFPRETALSLVQSDLISELIDSMFTTKSSKTLAFITFLYEKACKNQTLSQWYVIRFVVDDRITDICDLILNSEEFTPLSRAATVIMINYIKTNKKSFPKLDMVMEKLVTDFFKYPTNSFLHNSTDSIFHEFRRIRENFDAVIEKSNFCKKAMKAYQERRIHLEASYWGQLRHMTHDVRRPNVPEEKWISVIKQTNRETEAIIHHNKLRKPSDNEDSKPKTKQLTYMDVVMVFLAVLAAVLFYLNRK